MPLGRFSVLTFLGCLPWCLLLVAIGYAAGDNWEYWHRASAISITCRGRCAWLWRAGGYCGEGGRAAV